MLEPLGSPSPATGTFNLTRIPEQNLPDASITINQEKEEIKKDWYGPLGNFLKVKTKTIFDDSESIALRNNTESETGEEFYNGNDTKDIETLNQRQRPKTQIEILPHHETDVGYDRWNQHRPLGRLWDFCERIGCYRREGKNRRDTSTVSNRVLRLARFAAHWSSGKIMKPVVKKPSLPKL
jgi:hypothetical protein